MLWWTIRQLRSSDHNVQLEAVGSLASNPSPKAEAALIALLRESDHRDLRLAVLDALTSRGGLRVIDTFVGLARLEGDEGLCRAACDALVRLGWHESLASRLS